MRLDTFLSVSRIIKRRTLAQQLCKVGAVTSEGRVLKAGWPVKAGAVITVDYGNRRVIFRVEEVPDKKHRSCPESVTILERCRVADLG